MMFDLERVFTHKIRAEFLNYLINSFQIGPARRLADTGQAVISSDLYEMAITREYGFNFFDFHFKLGYLWMYKLGICDLQNFLQLIGFRFEPSMIFPKGSIAPEYYTTSPWLSYPIGKAHDMTLKSLSPPIMHMEITIPDSIPP